MITPSFGLTATERVLPKLALDFTTAALDSRVTFTRTVDATHPATYVNSSGVITAATNNQPRFDYDPVTLACKGLLIEESRTNLLIHSDDFATTWSVTAASVSTDVVVSPDGTQNADKLIESATTASHFINQTVATTNTTVYTASVYAKAGERSAFRISRAGGAVGSGFDLSTQQVFNASGASGTIADAGNGWYRCTMTFTTAATSTGIYFELQTTASGSSQSYTGNGTSGLYLYGAQFELGAFATSYIPTTTAALTRNADVATMTGTNFSDWFNASEGAFKTTLEVFTTATKNHYFVSANDGSVANSINLFQYGATSGQQIKVANVTQAETYAGSMVLNTFSTLCMRYKANSFAVSRDGSAPTTDSSGSVPTVTQLSIASAAGASMMNGHIKSIFYYPQALTNSEVQAFSKG